MYLILGIIAVIVALVFLFSSSYVVKNHKGENKNNANKKIISHLSQEEKVADFSYLYEVIEENYPFLEVNKRVNNVDWNANKELYNKRMPTLAAFFYLIFIKLNGFYKHYQVNLNMFIFFIC